MREFQVYEDLHLALNPSIKVIRRLLLSGYTLASVMVMSSALIQLRGETGPSVGRIIAAVIFFSILGYELIARGSWRGLWHALLDFLPSYLMLWWETDANGYRHRHMALTRNVRTPQREFATVYYFRLSPTPRHCYIITSSRWNLPPVCETFRGCCYFARMGYRWWDRFNDRLPTFVWQRPDGTMAQGHDGFNEDEIAAAKKRV